MRLLPPSSPCALLLPGTSGNGQQPQPPDCRRQQVLPSGQLTSPSHFTSCTGGERRQERRGKERRGTGDNHAHTCGQGDRTPYLCTRALNVATSSLQEPERARAMSLCHPELPVCSPSSPLQVPVSAGSLVTKSVVSPFLERHLLICRSHIVPSGQQCRWSGQQTA